MDLSSPNHVNKLAQLPNARDCSLRMVGSCDGLLCLSNVDNEVVLWNVATRERRQVPDNPIMYPDNFTFYANCDQDFNVAYGFGYDSGNEDYKVVRMLQFYDINDNHEKIVEVFSLKSNAWKRAPDFPYFLYWGYQWGTYANGNLHWLLSEQHINILQLIVAFDISVEKYRQMPLPNISDYFLLKLREFEGCLCLLCIYGAHEKIDVWVMKQYGVKESWVKMYSLAETQLERGFDYIVPLAYSMNGEELFLGQDDKNFLWYDLEKKTVINAQVFGVPEVFQSKICVDSLVKLDDNRGTGEKKHPERAVKKEQGKRKNRHEFLLQGFKLVL
ncbi:F-box protein [Quillaja saponaria]|uniref:F-box protein n=1 Tax=Quillaja saponaria TaxID=32244 RepID=A0AAD7M0N9_QUISA|nr:F-box protein [Quillaja saponaria]